MNLVEFPGLGLKFAVNRVAFEVFGISIYWYGIIIAAAFLAAVLLGLRDCKKFGIDPDTILDCVLIAAPTAIVCARLYYVAFSWDMFKDDLLSIFNTRLGGLAIYGGIIGAFLAAYIYARVKKINILNLFDFTAPFIVLGQAIGRWGNFVNQEAFGTQTTLPWRMTSDTVREYLASVSVPAADMVSKVGVHPTFLYESLVDIAIFFLLMWFRHKKKANGEVFFMYMMLYGIGRACIEGLRTDSLMLGIGSIRVSQLLAVLFVIAFAVMFAIVRKNYIDKTEEGEVEAGSSSYGTVLTKLKEMDEAEAAQKELEEQEHQKKLRESDDVYIAEENDVKSEADKADESSEAGDEPAAGDVSETEDNDGNSGSEEK